VRLQAHSARPANLPSRSPKKPQPLLAHRVSGAAFDRHLGDQILLPLCLASGCSRFSVEEITAHLESNAWVIERFGMARIAAENAVSGRKARPCAPDDAAEACQRSSPISRRSANPPPTACSSINRVIRHVRSVRVCSGSSRQVGAVAPGVGWLVTKRSS
jgi:hypothetical protein